MHLQASSSDMVLINMHVGVRVAALERKHASAAGDLSLWSLSEPSNMRVLHDESYLTGCGFTARTMNK